MKRKLIKGSVLLAVACLAITSAQGININLEVGLTDSHALGDVINGIQAGGQANRDATMVNNLLSVALGTQSDTVSGDVGDLYQRTANGFPSLPAAVTTRAQYATGITDGTSSYDIPLTSGFQYLVAAYDGPNGGVEIWDIADIASGNTIVIPRYAQPLNGTNYLVASTKYRMTGWTLLNPAASRSIPDDGTTVALLGCALAGIGLLRRKFSHN